MKREHVRMINAGAIGMILGALIMVAAAAIFDADSTQAEAEVEYQTETEEVSSISMTDSQYFDSMPDNEKNQLIAIICLATDKGNSPSDVSESIAENFDAISEDYAMSLVTASLLTVCNQASE